MYHPEILTDLAPEVVVEALSGPSETDLEGGAGLRCPRYDPQWRRRQHSYLRVPGRDARRPSTSMNLLSEASNSVIRSRRYIGHGGEG
jgi:hypothetical protein